MARHLSSQARTNALIVATTLVLFSTTAASARYSAEQIRQGLPVDAVRASVESDGQKIHGSNADNFWWIYRTGRNEQEIVGILRFCGRLLYEQSLAATGGTSGFIKRIAQFENQYGPGKYVAEALINEIGEKNSLEVSWKLRDLVLTLTFIAAVGKVSETQWSSMAVPSVCNK